MQEMADYLKTQSLVDKFATYADSHGLKRRNLMIKKSYSLLDRFINSRIIYTMLDEQSWYQYINQDDPVIGTAINVFREGKAFPSIVKKKAKK